MDFSVMRATVMRILPLILVGASALILSACDGREPRKGSEPKAQAAADCCCKDRCPNPPQSAAAPVVGTLAQEGAGRAGGHARRAVRNDRAGHRHRARTGAEGVGYLDEEAYGYRRVERSGTEGVGYLDEGDAYRGGDYRRAGTSVSVDTRETYSESARYSESQSGYSYSSGGGVVVYSDDGHGRHGRRGGGGYAGVDRDGYLTWPGKTD